MDEQTTPKLYCHSCGSSQVSTEAAPAKGWARCMNCGAVDRVKRFRKEPKPKAKTVK